MIPGGAYIMINLILTIYVALWTYKAGIHKSYIYSFIWAIVAATSFITIQFLWFWIDAYLILNPSHPIFGPPIAGFLVVAFIRTHFFMHAPLTLPNLFGHLNIFAGLIKQKKGQLIPK